MALACDIIIMGDEALIGHPGVRGLGSPPINFWFYHVGPQWAKRLLLTGDRLRGKDAARIGLVMDSVPEAELDAEVHSLAKRMELAGARTLQKLATEIDARAHLSKGPAKQAWKANVTAHGVRKAIKLRDADYAEGDVVRIRAFEDER
jgi:enoyl-CoA hydratase